jgi:general secretion pathway protein A
MSAQVTTPKPAKIKIAPFSISPNPTFLYFTPALEASVFRVRYTVDNRQGLAAILGDVGLGKSSLVRYLHSGYDAREDAVSILLPTGGYKSDFAFLQAICSSVGVPPKRSAARQKVAFEEWLGEQFTEERNVVLFIDEAQKLSNSQLEFVRDFLNFETNESKLIQVVLAGQLELRDRMLTPALKAIYSRLIGPCLLAPLTASEISEMIRHRCQLYRMENPFTQAAIEKVFLFSAGVPRAALRLYAFSHEWARLTKSDKVEPDHVESAYQDLKIEDEKENGGES